MLAGSVPTLSVGVDPSTNHIIGQSYDANGNVGSSPSGMMLGYDAENRMTLAQSSSLGVQYAYDGQNKRIWSCNLNMSSGQCPAQQTVYFYGPNGKLLAQFNANYTGPTGINGNLTPTLSMGPPGTRLYFGSRLLGNEDRLGSRGRYYPYGEDRPPSGQQNPGDGGVAFATYTRDSATGLNYADQRYYATGWGRFASPDHYGSSGGPGVPQSWNRYAYVQGEPVNSNDRHGLLLSAESCIGDPDACEADDAEGTDINISGVGSEGGSEAPVCAAWWLDYTEGEGIPSGCPTGGAPQPSQTKRPKRKSWFLVITDDCYKVPVSGSVTREIDYKLEFSDSETSGYPSSDGVIWEHLTGAIPISGTDSPSDDPPGTFDDLQSIVAGVSGQHVVQTFSVKLNNGTNVGLTVPAFGGYPQLDIWKYAGYVSINGNIGGQVDPKTGKLIPGTYKPCAN